MVSNVSEWHWSSYKAMTGEELVPDYLEVDWLLSQFSDNRYQAFKVYADFVQKGLVQKSNWDDLNQAISLGNEDFINKVHTKAGLLKKKLSEIHKNRNSHQPDH